MQHIIQACLFLGRLAVGHADELLIGLPELLEGGEGLVGRADRAGVQDDAAARELLAAALDINPNAGEILMRYGMHCLGCAIAHGETVGEAAQVHGADLDKMLEELNNI